MIISILYMRPTLLGSEYTVVGLLFTSISLFYYIVFVKNSLHTEKIHLYMFSLFTIMWLYLLNISVLNDAINVGFTIKAFISNVFIFGVFGYILSNKQINLLFFKTLVYIMSILGFSEIISTILIEFIGVESLVLFKISKYNILFPFSLEYGVYTVPGVHVFHRFMEFFREPGLAQAFLSWALVYAYYFKFPKWIIIGIIIGIILTLSTIAIVNLLMVITLLYIVNGNVSIVKRLLRSSISIVFGIVIILIAYYLPAIGLKAKSETHGVSISDRTDNIIQGIQNMLDNPFGTGLYGTEETHSGINLIAMSDEIGLPALFFAIFIFFTPFLFRKVQNNYYYLVSIIPILFTSLVAQPILDAPLVYIFLFATFIISINHTKGFKNA